ncbi:hypothetical protein C3747_28g239 [Trypanosoma cruzi]|uniref:HYDIN/VesB/CFA65-like Ig-like domain-containing protein n=1 Tax=Trypanosoma cruzi TaxID=5693 RepID=A0A2V2X4H2_TRYCR|nr:hypothetical protein C3747_28g239 [Trypanosoma cruzi]
MYRGTLCRSSTKYTYGTKICLSAFRRRIGARDARDTFYSTSDRSCGLISETFHIHLHGSLDELTIRIRGSVTGPALRFEVEELDFGNVSYNCLHSRVTQMVNVGQVPITFRLRVPESSLLHGLITVSPSEGIILPKQQEEIHVSLVSDIVGNCETMLLVDVEGVGDGVDSIPSKRHVLYQHFVFPRKGCNTAHVLLATSTS